MTRFQVQMVLVCPSDWNEAKTREYLHRIAVTAEERESLKVRRVKLKGPTPEQMKAIK